jgi:hypothetical protein
MVITGLLHATGVGLVDGDSSQPDNVAAHAMHSESRTIIRSSIARIGDTIATLEVAIMSNNVPLKLVWFSIAAVLGVSAGCSDNPRTPTAPTASIAHVTGLLRGEAPVVSRIWRAHPALPNAIVTVIGGPASGTKTTTDAEGEYQLTAAGAFKLRFEHPSFVTTESNELTMTAAGVTAPEVTLVTAPWSISGRVLDSLGNPVVDAEVAASYNSFFAPDYGRVRTDAAGRYTISSSQPRFETVLVGATKPSFEAMQQLLSAKCCGAVPDIRIVRIVSITPTAPTSIRVGDSVEMPASVVVFDTGETRNIFVLPTSSAPSVVDVARSSHWYAMRGVSAGTATLTFDLRGAIATTQVQVR